MKQQQAGVAAESTGRPGAAIKALRRGLDLTLAQASLATGIPLSTLSRIENDLAWPTYDHLVRLSQGLNVDISSLFASAQAGAPPAKGARRSINRLHDGGMIDTGSTLLRYLSMDLREKEFTPILAEISAGSIEEHGPYLRHPGEEFVFVVSGTLALHSEAYSPVVLHQGESIYFDSSTGHAYVRHGEAPCVVLSICTVPHSHPDAAPQD